ncbi:MAG: hypothetical protein KatS3mg038_1307 [Candidatus Kapaibacterium sp.]|nr:MAG: hypothetical protein KatS3mg038_1307 [Candidatus Kapabacteria bacterium]
MILAEECRRASGEACAERVPHDADAGRTARAGRRPPPGGPGTRRVGDGDARVQRVGFYKSPNFRDALINAVIHNLGGWRIFVQRCDDAEDQKFLRMDFIRTYASFARCGPPPGSTGPLQGEFARVNALLGHVGPNDAPVLVGDDGRPGEQQPITIDSRPKLPMPFRRLPE